MVANTIDEVIECLENIIQTSKNDESVLGYFATLYQKVTMTVKEKLGQNYFDDDVRMERLDVLFANRYLEAYSNYKQGNTITKSWEIAFNSSKSKHLIVLQHLIFGMNAHINLDLGIAAAQVSNASSINSLESDFTKINDILGSLIDEVKNNLSLIWKPLVWILKQVKKADNFLINFSMSVARDGAWKFANELVLIIDETIKRNLITQRDDKILALSKCVMPQGKFESFIFKMIRFTERGSVSSKIELLKKKIN
jgi:Family of unknown function (DUF5995)